AAGAPSRGPAGLAGAAEFVEAWPAGYQTALGERATRLSPGQRQKIALARAFLRDAPILLLDEPAAHLDPVSARQIGDAVGAVPAGRTVILITHRQDQAGSADRVIRLDRGGVAAAGHPPGSGARPLAAVPRGTGVPGARCCACCGWPGRCARACCSRCWPVPPRPAAAWRCSPCPGSCSPAPPSIRAS